MLQGIHECMYMGFMASEGPAHRTDNAPQSVSQVLSGINRAPERHVAAVAQASRAKRLPPGAMYRAAVDLS